MNHVKGQQRAMSIIPNPGPAPSVPPLNDFVTFDNERIVAADEVIYVRDSNVVFRPTFTGQARGSSTMASFGSTAGCRRVS